MRRRYSLPLVALAAVAGSLAIAAPASAHGYVSAPPSRQALCAQGVVVCGQIKYEPQSVEGPKGLHSCSGGNAQFAELDDNSKNWPATSVGSTVTFNWVFTARHATLNWQYYIGNTLLASISGNNQQPPASVSHTVNLGGYTGRQTILAVWNIADTANAFYSCVDVQIGGGGGGTPPPPPPGTCSAPAWSASQVYVGGNTVSYGGHTWQAKWWTQGETPGTSEVWADQGACLGTAATMAATRPAGSPAQAGSTAPAGSRAHAV